MRWILRAWVDCRNCSGTGQKDGKTCVACRGDGGTHTETI
jgi:DnaJ-class molecular chaperone